MQKLEIVTRTNSKTSFIKEQDSLHYIEPLQLQVHLLLRLKGQRTLVNLTHIIQTRVREETQPTAY